MKIIKASPTGHLKGIRNFFHKPSPSQEVTFQKMKDLFKESESQFQILKKPPFTYELWTRWGYRTKSNHPQDVKSVLFASLTIYEKHIALYFYPVYLDKSISDQLPDSLLHYLTGKSTFHIEELSEDAEPAFRELIQRGVDFYKRMHLI